MELNYFKDQVFDLINECDTLKIADLNVDDKEDLLFVCVADGSVFEVKFRKVK